MAETRRAVMSRIVGFWGEPFLDDFEIHSTWVDGIRTTELQDSNDFKVMERHICLRLRGQGFCGDPDTNPWEY